MPWSPSGKPSEQANLRKTAYEVIVMRMKNSPLYLLMALVMLAATLLPGCAAKDMAALAAEKQSLESKVTDLESQLAEQQGLADQVTELNDQLKDKQALESRVLELEDQLSKANAASTAAPVAHYAIGINALLAWAEAAEPAVELVFSGPITVTAAAVVPHGMVFSHWNINGKPITAQGETLSLDVTGNTVVEAVLRKELKVTVINAYLQLLDSKGNAKGNKVKEYVFEKAEGKKVSLYIHAEVPKNHVIDHWRINGVAHYFDKTVTGIKVFNLDTVSVYEVVLKKVAPTPKPAVAPTKAPVQKVSINCTNCTFSGGGYTNAKSGLVPKGTRITVTGTIEIGNPQYWEINGVANSSYGKTFQYTANGNTTFKYTGYN